MNKPTAMAFLGLLAVVAPQAKGQGTMPAATANIAAAQVMPDTAITAPTVANSIDLCPPPAVVISFLGFTETQAAQFKELFGQFETTLHGLQAQIAVRQALLDTQLNQPSPNPTAIVNLVLQIHALQQQAGHAVQSYQSLFAGLLTDEQKQKIQAVTLASQLQPVVGPFVGLYLVPAPTPLPCHTE